MAKSKSELAPGLTHLITVGTTYPGSSTDVIAALLEDLRGAKPRRVVLIATEDSSANGERILSGLGIAKADARIRRIKSPHSLDEAYHATSEAITRLVAEGVTPREIILHYTAGTKVMSAGAVLAAVNHGVQSFRYLYSKGPRQESVPVTTPTSSILADQKFRMAMTLMLELRFRAASDILGSLSTDLPEGQQREVASLLRSVAWAYSDWDNFRVKDFLSGYRAIGERLKESPMLARFALERRQLDALNQIRKAASNETAFPHELLIELVNNAIRRLMERRPDDALIRLHRAAELYAQSILMSEFGIRTDDVEIRKVPPRSRMAFEAERRIDDAKIKLGLRKSYELLSILEHPVGRAFLESASFRDILHERRNLVLAHGTRPATTRLALNFLRDVEALLLMQIPDVHARAARQQFPWIDNEKVLARLSRIPAGDESTPVMPAEAGAAPPPAGAAKPPRGKRRRSRG